MSKREPAFWVAKRNGKYEAQEGPDTDLYACRHRYSLAEYVHDGYKAVPVYVTVNKTTKGHSWAWACKRMLEGKSVKSLDDGRIFRLVPVIGGHPQTSMTWNPLKRDLEARDWVLAE